jgi:hypothetical protein
VERLRELLQRQLTLVHQGRSADAAALFEQTDRCVPEIAGMPDRERLGQDVERLYQELSLALTAQRAEVSAALRANRRGRAALRAYSSAAGLRR